ncbi:MAG TPA: UDP-N-acetylmuramate--L-alanine ligase [Rectinemataceae bacterium]|nr:UDP-N-acetylmuramate--L-alanine ligase [Rectinemataceae bacterium]
MQAGPALSSARGMHIHLVGAKGTGMTALAEILSADGAILSGSDVADVFYTDAILKGIGVQVASPFSEANLGPELDLVVHSAAYRRDLNPELLEAARRGIPVLSYPEALGELSLTRDSSAIAGVHGKTTTTALAGTIAASLAIPATILAGSAVSTFGGRSTMIRGSRYFIAETCEYRRHFLSFHPRRIVLTSVEHDHQDYFPSYADILSAFVEFAQTLPAGGLLIYCADDRGACEAVAKVAAGRPDIVLLPYGKTATGDYRISDYRVGQGLAHFRLAGFHREFELRIPGEHIALDATAALALAFSVHRDAKAGAGLEEADVEAARRALASFSGSKRRSEILGSAGDVLFMDDYAHHPTAIREGIRGLKAFWPGRRLVVDFMSHTYSRTKALFGDFAASLDGADAVVLHRIYASARELPEEGVSGRLLFEAVRDRRSRLGIEGEVMYWEDPLDAKSSLHGFLRPGDLFITMGAGDNWRLGAELFDARRNGGKAE